MKAIFLSDVHLQSKRDPGYKDLMAFLGGISGNNDAGKAQEPGKWGLVPTPRIAIDCLFLGGDFFDFWFCRNDQVYPDFVEVIERLGEIQAAGVPVSLCEGNHDFYLAEYFSLSRGMTVFPEFAVLDMDGQRILLSHGDTIDRRNRKYLLLRKLLRSRTLYRLQRRIPLPLLWRLARISSRMSKELTIASREALAKKMRSFSGEKFQDGFDAVILGHCHLPLLEESLLGGQKKVFATLGDWNEHRSYLYYEDGRFSLSSYRLPGSPE